MSVADDRAQARLAELRHEYQEGERRLQALAQQEASLRETLLRISGAIQVLTELLDEPQPRAEADTPAPAPDSPREPADGSRVMTVR